MHTTPQPAASSPAELIEARRRSLANTLGRPLRRPKAADSPFPEEQRRYLLEEVQELYWNDLEWENVTGEEELEGGALTALTFPGVMAFVRGLLLTEVPADSLAGPSPRPGVVDDFLAFLAERTLELRGHAGSQDGSAGASSGDPVEGDDPSKLERDLRMTSELIDQVLMVYHGVSPEDVGPQSPEDPGRET